MMYLFSDYRTDENGNILQYKSFNQFKEMIKQSKNLGEDLVRINSTDVLMISGEHKKGNSKIFKNPDLTSLGLNKKHRSFFTCSDPKYFMILNGLTHGNGRLLEEQYGSSYETKQSISVTFDLPNGISP